MAEAHVSKEFAVAPEKVWAVISDPKRFEEWLTVHTKWKEEPPAVLAKGATMAEVLTIMGMANTITFTVEEYDAPNSTRFSGAGMAGAKITFTLSVVAQGPDASVATVDAEFVSQMMVGAIGGAVERATTKELTASLDNLEKLVA
ncbi:carbon monoxide dehydrogenase subunit G [Amycolatopsis lexingtonensis]|uniref:Carbon monoxide dehydrogenase subunit G n=1 Tax=Amycolatopsis lexingtonensis TaxID=218822 RepID=A0ABR9HYZ4_9PSEU|nr:SRPBCC family protein [Amycolatopsis lexingtonensis]MBE1496130.1 carbon monoxide dehydrogenase subunit G [Amycolatopsis lexingtonensis]